MTRRILFIAIALVFTIISMSAQKITLKATNKPADRVFAEIMRQTNKNFVYPSALLKGKKVSVDASAEQLESVLKKMFAGTNIAYRMRGNNIMLYELPHKETTVAKPQPREAIVSGYVREAESNEALIGAMVTDVRNKRTVQTNNAGYYSLQAPVGTTEIVVEYPGYNRFESQEVMVKGNTTFNVSLSPVAELDEVVVIGSKNRGLAMDAAEAGSYNLSAGSIQSAPMVLGESDVIKALQFQPGVIAGADGMAGMNVHGGGSDENLYMLDNIPLYQVNHFGGLFSAFNVESVKNVDFYKSSFPAKYDGRLSSYVDVHTKDGSLDAHHGSVRLGLASGAFHIDGPIAKSSTSYSFSLRRSWYDVLTIPMLAILNSTKSDDDEKTHFNYSFTDLNGKITHRFSDRSAASVMVYYGSDALGGGSTWQSSNVFEERDHQGLRWGNLLIKGGWDYSLTPTLFGEFSAAYSRYSGNMKSESEQKDFGNRELIRYYKSTSRQTNNIDDWTLRADFGWRPASAHNISFGASATYHSFLPQRVKKELRLDDITSTATDDGQVWHAWEENLYIGDDWSLNDLLRVNLGIHASLFSIGSKTFYGISPRTTARYYLTDSWTIKGGYSRTTQYVHQLTDSYISLPTDQWVPVTPGLRPQTADKVFAGIYHSIGADWTFSLEGYYKWMHNLLDYRDEYYLTHPLDGWLGMLTMGSGTAKGIDFKVARETGNITGHLSYSLLWADRKFEHVNGGKRFPSRLDNRHKINAMINWKVNKTWELNAAWTGMSGNRITLPLQVWATTTLPGSEWAGSGDYSPVSEGLNNYRLPFYHRLDISAIRHTKKGFWTFSLYNAYCNMNVVAVRMENKLVSVSTDSHGNIVCHTKPVFQKLHLIPVIPSVSYTWIF